MPLQNDVTDLRDRVVHELNAAFDYYTDTKIAWNLAQTLIATGHTVSIRNMTTGTVTTEAELASRARDYVAVQLAQATFQQFLSIFEHFYFEIVRLWLTADPRSLAGKTLDFKTVLESSDKNAVIRIVVDKEVNDLMYKRPKEWFGYLEAKAKLGCPAG